MSTNSTPRHHLEEEVSHAQSKALASLRSATAFHWKAPRGLSTCTTATLLPNPMPRSDGLIVWPRLQALKCRRRIELSHACKASCPRGNDTVAFKPERITLTCVTCMKKCGGARPPPPFILGGHSSPALIIWLMEFHAKKTKADDLLTATTQCVNQRVSKASLGRGSCRTPTPSRPATTRLLLRHRRCPT